MAKETKEVKKVETKEVATIDNTLATSMAEASGAGFENVNPTRDLQMPFLQIIQALSPERKRADQKFIEDSEEGDVFNSVTRKLYKVGEPNNKPIIAIPCGFVRVWNEWKLRRLGGGFVKTWHEGKVPPTHKGDGKEEKFDICDHNKDNQIVETAMHSFIVIEDDGSRYPTVISMVSSQLKKSRQLMSKCDARRMLDPNTKKQFRPPLFANRVAISTTLEKFAEGEAWGWKIDLIGEVDNEQFMEAKGFHDVTKDRLALQQPTQENTTTESPY